MATKRTFDESKVVFGGCLPSKFDRRDYNLKYATGAVAGAAEYPKEFRITNKSKIYSQGATSMCVAYSLAEIKESQELVDQKKRVRFSPGFIYANRSETMEGMYVRPAIAALLKDGVCTYDEFPVTGTCEQCKKKLSEIPNLLDVFDDAVNWRIGSYYRLYTLDEIKYTLMNIGPVFISVPTYSGWNSFTGEIKEEGTKRGYHAMVIVGWKDDDTLIVQNSWGTVWGDKGYGYIKWGYPIMEMWAMTDYAYAMNIPKRKWYQTLFLEIGNLWRHLLCLFRKS